MAVAEGDGVLKEEDITQSTSSRSEDSQEQRHRVSLPGFLVEEDKMLRLALLKRRYEMNTIRMPGFVAENALCKSGGKYDSGTGPATGKNSSGIIPQAATLPFGGGPGEITIEPEQCEYRCRWRCGRYGCYPTDCYWVCF